MTWTRQAGNGQWNSLPGQGTWGTRRGGIGGRWASSFNGLTWQQATLDWAQTDNATWHDLEN